MIVLGNNQQKRFLHVNSFTDGTGAYSRADGIATCTTTGTTAIQSKSAYGSWEFDVYKGADGNVNFINFISDRIAAYNNFLGYTVFLNDNESVRLFVVNNGGGAILFYTAASYIANNTLYRLKVARLKSEGVFKDIETLQTSDMVNSNLNPYPSFTSNGRYGFNAISNGDTYDRCGTEDEISITNGAKYLVEFDLKLNSGGVPSVVFKTTFSGGSISNYNNAISGKNSMIFTTTVSTTGRLIFQNDRTATDYTISNLTIRRIYDADTFAVFIKGGAFGTAAWTLVDTTGGSGSNPVTDSINTTSEYFVADLDAGDKFGNITYKPWI